jgi:hypothetical protein
MSATPADEVDFGRYWAALGARWWLLVAGLLAGAVVGYLTASGAKQVNRASETIYLGQPLTAGGSGLIQTLQTNPSVVRQVIHSNDAIAKAAAAAGLKPSDFRAGITSVPVPGFVIKLGQTPLVAISVTADIPPAKGRAVVQSLANSALTAVSGYVDQKVAQYHTQIAQDQKELDIIDARLAAVTRQVTGHSVSSTDKLMLLNLQALAEQRRTNVLTDQLQTKQLLVQSEAVERGHVVGSPSSAKTTARSKRNAVAVGAFLGLLLGAVAALLLARRRPA